MKLEDMKKSVSYMTPDEVRALIKRIRSARLTQQQRAKRPNAKPQPKKKGRLDLGGLTVEAAAKLLDKLEVEP